MNQSNEEIALLSSKSDNNVTECSVKLIKRYYHKRSYFTYVANLSTKDLIANLLSKQMKFAVINLDSDLDFLKQFRSKHHFYVFILSFAKEFERFISIAYRTLGWNTRANILIIFIGSNAEVVKIFRICWKYYSINVSILTANDLNIYTYFPISENNCGQNIDPFLLGNCLDEVEVFPEKLDKYFYGCPIKVLPIVIEPYVLDLYRKHNPGYEMVMLRAICQHLNLTISYVDNPFKHWGTKLSDGTYTDMYLSLYEMKAELLIGMILANESYVEDFENTYPHSEVDLAFHVPTPLMVEGWKNFIIIFSNKLWFSFGGAMVSCIFAWWFIGKNQETSEGFDKIENCAFKVWCVMFSTFSNQPKNGLIRLIYIVWTLYSFVIISTYTSVLMSFLTRPSYEKEIATTTDMVNSNLKYGGLYAIRYVFNEPGNKVYLTLYKRFMNCALAMGCTNRTAFRRDFGVIKNVRQVNYYVPLVYTDSNGRPKIKRVKDTIVPQDIWLNTVKGFLYMDRFNEVILKLRESGFIFKWDYEATSTWKRSTEVPPSVIPLSLTHLKFGFFCLLIGLFVALLIFFNEIGVFKWAKNWFSKGKSIAASARNRFF